LFINSGKGTNTRAFLRDVLFLKISLAKTVSPKIQESIKTEK
jgi:hypothetical protein